MKNILKKLSLLLIPFLFLAGTLSANAENEEEVICAVYITGIGCPHCAVTDPVVLDEKLRENPNLVIIEYEIYQTKHNSRVILDYEEKYNTGFGVPLIIFDDSHVAGDKPILKAIDEKLANGNHNCPLLTGKENIKNYNFNEIHLLPKIWRNERILIPDGKYGDEKLLRTLFLTDDISGVLEKASYEELEPVDVPYSGGSFEFENAVKIDGWIFQWNDHFEGSPGSAISTKTSEPPSEPSKEITETKLTIPKLLTLSVVDAINPCALAVLTLMLIAILTYNPGKKIQILYAGIAFAISVFLMYLIYGLIIVKFFQLIQAITSARLILYKILGIIAILLGLLNIRDVVNYKAGRLGTEMPMFLRPKVKKIISGVTSPKGAFVVGMFVTVFLLPCTIGPYIIAGGILSTYDFVRTLPPLLLYNLIFVSPMIIITAIVYFGIRKVKDVSAWKDKNVRYLHLVAGIIMTLLGIAMIGGWV
ncbi:hypothetical protein GF366_01610 [Candidatus Peregrinibacteria bacterium]|nr:hypothetical protein [Candidatus Peregrinibacteria bacterium]